MKKEDKATAVAELTEKFGRARLAILTESVGLPVNQVTELRKQLRGAKAEYKIVKNTLAIRATEGTVLAGLAPRYRHGLSVARRILVTSTARAAGWRKTIVASLRHPRSRGGTICTE